MQSLKQLRKSRLLSTSLGFQKGIVMMVSKRVFLQVVGIGLDF